MARAAQIVAATRTRRDEHRAATLARLGEQAQAVLAGGGGGEQAGHDGLLDDGGPVRAYCQPSL
jgi:hypothetical protein